MTPTKEDWIIVRLMISTLDGNPRHARSSMDVYRSLVFLGRKLGFAQMEKMIDAIKEERVVL